jgi:hypothetical protein
VTDECGLFGVVNGAYRNMASIGIELAIRSSEQFGIPSSCLLHPAIGSRIDGGVKQKKEKELCGDSV